MGNTCALPAIPTNDVFFMYCKGRHIYILNAPLEAVSIINAKVQTYFQKREKIRQRYPLILRMSLGRDVFENSLVDSQAPLVRLFLCKLQTDLAKGGWFVVGSPTLTYRDGVATWMFKRQPTIDNIDPPLSNIRFVAVSLSSSNRLQLLDFPDDLISGVLSAISDGGLVNFRVDRQNVRCVQINFQSNIWTATGELGARGRHIVVSLVRSMAERSWGLVNSARIKRQRGCDTLFFCQSNYTARLGRPDWLPPPTGRYFGMAIKSSNYLMLFNTDQEVQNLIVASCRRHWSGGVSRVSLRYGYPCVFLSGAPWHLRHRGEMAAKQFITLLLQNLSSAGWLLSQSVSCSRSLSQKSLLVFESCGPARLLHCCLAGCGASKFCILNAPSEVAQTCRSAASKYYPKRLIQEAVWSTSCLMFRLGGHPSSGTSTRDTLLWQYTLCAIMQELLASGWRLMGTADTLGAVRHNVIASGTAARYEDAHALSVQCLWFARPFEAGTSVSAGVAAPIEVAPLQPSAPVLPPGDDDPPPSYWEATRSD